MLKKQLEGKLPPDPSLIGRGKVKRGPKGDLHDRIRKEKEKIEKEHTDMIDKELKQK